MLALQEAVCFLEHLSQLEHNYIALPLLFEIRTAVVLNVQIFWDIRPSRLSNILSSCFAPYLVAEIEGVKLKRVIKN
jgi:hypothetical protein